MEFTIQLYGIYFAYDVVRYSYRIIRTKIYIDKLYQYFLLYTIIATKLIIIHNIYNNIYIV